MGTDTHRIAELETRLAAAESELADVRDSPPTPGGVILTLLGFLALLVFLPAVLVLFLTLIGITAVMRGLSRLFGEPDAA